MKLLNLILPALGDYFTFYKGGGGGGSSTTQNQLDPTIRPFVEYGLNEAKSLYQNNTPQYYQGQTYISPSLQTQFGLQAAQNRALSGNPLLPAAQQQQQDVIGGAYLQNNPYFNQAMQGAAQGATQNYYDAIMKAQSNASQAGRYGSDASSDLQNRAATTLANTLANKYGEFAYQNYANERSMQNQAAQYAPTLANADYADIQQLMNVGKTAEDYQKTALQSDINKWNYEQNLPYQKLSSYLGAAYGAPTGTVSTTTQSGGGKIVCTAMNQAYGFGSFRQAIWLQHSANMPNAKTIEKGYHRLFLPVVAFAFSDKKSFARKLVRNIAEHIARHRTADLWKEMRGKRRDPLGRLYRAIIEPICYLAGKVK